MTSQDRVPMDDLLPFYERELASLRHSMKEFAARHPGAATRLAITGEHSDDPHVERMLQSFALLAARIEAKIEDDYPEFTEGMLEVVFPQYLRPFPSCSIAQFDVGNLFETLTEPKVVPRATTFLAKSGGYQFRSAYEVTLAPLSIEAAGYLRTAAAPSGVSLPQDTSGLLSITLRSLPGNERSAFAADKLRLYVSGAREAVAATLDGLLLHAASAFVEADRSGRWKPLARGPISPVGFEDTEALLDTAISVTSAFRLLMEYSAFPEKFDFVDIDLKALKQAAGSCERLTLHLAIANVHADSWPAIQMARLTAESLKLFCTPVVNLFCCQAQSIETRAGVDVYSIVPDGKSGATVADTEIYSIDRVRRIEPARETTIQPFWSLMHGSSARLTGPYWVARRNGQVALKTPGLETEFALVDLDGMPAATEMDALALDLTCTNRNLPAVMRIEAPEGDLEIQGVELKCPITLLCAPTESIRPPCTDDALWRIVGHLSTHPIQLSQGGLEDLKRLFGQFAALSATPARHLEGLTNLSCRSSMEWIVMAPCPAFVRGLGITLTLDEQAFAGQSVSTFIDLMDRFFAPYAPTNSFIKLTVVSRRTGADIRRCEPRQGQVPLL
ncbi:type VI secretion system baseplate subunit TssF [Trinickia fusca]|uniref:Type VI secretion system baseplate subunit TssF n=2 Tax=Trinickia fusca TaxID=2419777 RepID=A0A494XFK3_9BURK|nr:type VI secretion system baseplate subunit TssF [Trinickia fusca]